MRMFVFHLFLCLFSFVSIYAGTVGSTAPSFDCQDVLTEKEISLDALTGKIVVLEWIDCDSPYVKKQYAGIYSDDKGNIPGMQEKLKEDSYEVVWITIASASPRSKSYRSPSQWKAWLLEKKATPCYFFIDSEQELAKKYKVTCAPEIFIVDAKGILAYRGALDSMNSTKAKDILKPGNRNYVFEAIKQLSSGKRVFTDETIPYGNPAY